MRSYGRLDGVFSLCVFGGSSISVRFFPSSRAVSQVALHTFSAFPARRNSKYSVLGYDCVLMQYQYPQNLLEIHRFLK